MLTTIVILVALNVLAFTVRAAVRTESSGAERLSATATLTPRPKNCPDARRAVRYYQRHYAEWRAKMGAGHTSTRGDLPPCPRYLAERWKRKAYLARVRYFEWREYHYAWWRWLPDKWQRIGACETGYGRRPGNWRHSNSSYEGAFGFAKSSWDAFKYRADPKAGPYPADAWQATPRQQYEVALAIYRAYGFSGWGCRGA